MNVIFINDGEYDGVFRQFLTPNITINNYKAITLSPFFRYVSNMFTLDN